MGSNERLATVSKEDLKRFAHICPDFVIELASKSDDLVHLKKKMEKYLQNGVRLGWLIDPFEQQTIIYHPEREPQIKAFTEELTGEEVLPGFNLIIAELMTE